LLPLLLLLPPPGRLGLRADLGGGGLACGLLREGVVCCWCMLAIATRPSCDTYLLPRTLFVGLPLGLGGLFFSQPGFLLRASLLGANFGLPSLSCFLKLSVPGGLKLQAPLLLLGQPICLAGLKFPLCLLSFRGGRCQRPLFALRQFPRGLFHRRARLDKACPRRARLGARPTVVPGRPAATGRRTQQGTLAQAMECFRGWKLPFGETFQQISPRGILQKRKQEMRE
jgi:hypothetical protein